MLKCKDTSRLMASDEVLDASRSQRLAVRFHLLMCRHCRRYAAQLRTIGAASRKVLRGADSDPEQLAKLERSIIRRTLRNRGGESNEEFNE